MWLSFTVLWKRRRLWSDELPLLRGGQAMALWTRAHSTSFTRGKSGANPSARFVWCTACRTCTAESTAPTHGHAEFQRHDVPPLPQDRADCAHARVRVAAPVHALLAARHGESGETRRHMPCRPKPNHYLEWLLTGKCAFRGMCELVRRWPALLCFRVFCFVKVKSWSSCSAALECVPRACRASATACASMLPSTSGLHQNGRWL